MIRLGIIGAGYWGINYVRVFSELPDATVAIVCDANADRLRLVRERYPQVAVTTAVDEVFSRKGLDAVLVATPATTHYEIGRRCLLAGKHVLVEKPLTTNAADGDELIRVAKEQNRILMVGHTFLYNSAVRKLKELVSSDNFGKPYYLHATRTNMGPIRQDINVSWDLASHDVSIFNYLLEAQPDWVSAVGSRSLGSDREDVAFCNLHYPNNVLANVHVSWLEPNKVREVVAVGSRQRVVFDDLDNLEHIRIFEKGVAASNVEAESFGEFRLLVRDGDIISPRVDAAEPLKTLAAHFLECIATNTKPLTDGANGVAVVKAMCAINESLAQNGVPVRVA